MGVPIWLQIGDASGMPPSMRRAPNSVWLIADSSSQLGLALAKDVLQRGHRAVLAASNTAAVQDLAKAFLDTALVAALDGTSTEDVTRVVQESKGRFGPVEILVNTPGVGSLPALG